MEPAPLPDLPPEPTVGPHEVHRTSLLKRIAGWIGAVLLFGLKIGKFLFLGLKGVKFFGTAISMVISVGAYTIIFGWKFALGFVLLIFVHELGHAIQLKREGVDAGAPVFIPFLGAFIAMRELPRDAAMEARVGIAGPILGTVGAGVVHLAALATGSDLLLALAFTGYFLNLFNLVPVSPLDGGRVAAALSPKLWIAGLVVLVGLFLLRPNPILLFIVVFGGFESYKRLRGRDQNPEYYAAVTTGFKWWAGLTWLGLVLALVLLMDASHVARTI